MLMYYFISLVYDIVKFIVGHFKFYGRSMNIIIKQVSNTYYFF